MLHSLGDGEMGIRGTLCCVLDCTRWSVRALVTGVRCRGGVTAKLYSVVGARSRDGRALPRGGVTANPV